MNDEVLVIEETDRAQVLLHPTRLELMACLEEPSSAAELGRRLDLPRQRVNYHLRELEERGLVLVVEERKRGSVVERMYQRAGRGYTISDAALGRLGTEPETVQDRFSTAYQIALASKAVRDLGRLREKAREAEKSLPTFSLRSAWMASRALPVTPMTSTSMCSRIFSSRASYSSGAPSGSSNLTACRAEMAASAPRRTTGGAA